MFVILTEMMRYPLVMKYLSHHLSRMMLSLSHLLIAHHYYGEIAMQCDTSACIRYLCCHLSVEAALESISVAVVCLEVVSSDRLLVTFNGYI